MSVQLQLSPEEPVLPALPCLPANSLRGGALLPDKDVAFASDRKGLPLGASCAAADSLIPYRVSQQKKNVITVGSVWAPRRAFLTAFCLSSIRTCSGRSRGPL